MAALRDVGVKTQKVYPVSQRENVSLLIELQVEPGEKLFNLYLAVSEVIFVRVNEVEVIHVPGIILNPKPLLHEMVELVQKQQGQQLGGLVAKRQPICACVDIHAHEPENSVIYHLLS